MILKVTLLFEKEKAGQRINYNTQTGENHTNFESRKCIFHFNCIDTRCNTDACKNILQFICFDFFSIYIPSSYGMVRRSISSPWAVYSHLIYLSWRSRVVT